MKNVFYSTLLLDIIAIVISVVPIFAFNTPLAKEVDIEGVNGILTVSGIIIAFSSISFKDKITKRFDLLLLFSFSIYILAAGGYLYYLDLIKVGYPTFCTLLMLASSLFINMNHCFIFRVIEFLEGNWPMGVPNVSSLFLFPLGIGVLVLFLCGFLFF